MKGGKVNKRRLRMLANAAATKMEIADTEAARTCYRGVWGSLNFNNSDVPRASRSRDPTPVGVTEAAASLATLLQNDPVTLPLPLASADSSVDSLLV